MADQLQQNRQNTQPRHHESNPQHNNAPKPQQPTSTAPVIPIAVEQPVSPPKTFKDVLATLIVAMLEDTIKPVDAAHAMHAWYNNLSSEERTEFVAQRNLHDSEIVHVRGIVDTLAQELPYLYVK